MAKLKAYYLNGGDMLELVRCQEKKQSKAAVGEYDVSSSTQIMASKKAVTGRQENMWAA